LNVIPPNDSKNTAMLNLPMANNPNAMLETAKAIMKLGNDLEQ